MVEYIKLISVLARSAFAGKWTIAHTGTMVALAILPALTIFSILVR